MNSSTGNESRSTVRKTDPLWDPCLKLIRSGFLNADIHLDHPMGNMLLSISLLVMIRLLKKIICQWTASRTEIEATDDFSERMSVPFRYDPKDVYQTFRQMTNEIMKFVIYKDRRHDSKTLKNGKKKYKNDISQTLSSPSAYMTQRELRVRTLIVQLWSSLQRRISF